jgi:hypothetical protein
MSLLSFVMVLRRSPVQLIGVGQRVQDQIDNVPIR